MKSGSLSLVLWTVVVFLLSSGNSNPILHQAERHHSGWYTIQDGNRVELVYRGDFRTPEEIQSAQGFAPRVLDRELTELELEKSCSLFHHSYGSTAEYTKWVSTTTDPRVAHDFAVEPHAPGEIPVKRGYIYEIRADEKFVDVRASLGPENFRYAEQMEQAAVKPIPWDQVEGWYKLEDFSAAEMKTLAQPGGTLQDMSQFVDHFQKNELFDFHKYYGRTSAGARYELAGFRKGSDVWNKPPWSQYKDKSVPEAWERYAELACGANEVQIAGGFPRCPEGILARAEAEEFSVAEPLGARDLTGALQSGDPAQYKLDAKFVEASETGEIIEADEAAQAVELAEMESAIADTEAIDAIELGELLEGDLLLDIILGFLFL
ncbi:hypothetical protein GQX73_g3862 [Xylaria multiplex]|uniref:Enterotoxin n=1 Tax=Xylaria multiplex TaxID=323545 RepID=A0A7C8IS34_9PEZI|nr:hypothetical protein GQX73_g3862 [Xylaria multiplex]